MGTCLTVGPFYPVLPPTLTLLLPAHVSRSVYLFLSCLPPSLSVPPCSRGGSFSLASSTCFYLPLPRAPLGLADPLSLPQFLTLGLSSSYSLFPNHSSFLLPHALISLYLTSLSLLPLFHSSAIIPPRTCCLSTYLYNSILNNSSVTDYVCFVVKISRSFP